ncbi:hypothetical protein V1527DRAFT_255525 [Lipomyces starkeyi]
MCLDPWSINLDNGNVEDGIWITDEYGPYMHRYNSRGMMVQVTRATYCSLLDFYLNSAAPLLGSSLRNSGE